MKTKTASVIATIIGAVAIVASVAIIINLYNKDDSYKEKTIPPDAPAANIESFHYGYGSYFGGVHNYSIKEEDGKMMIHGTGGNGVELNLSREISSEQLEELRTLIIDNRIYAWDGFNERDDNILDGYSYDLKIRYVDGREITAEGYMKYPENYEQAHKNLAKFLESIK